MGSPPPAGSKKEVFRFRSVRSMVIPPARTGRERRSKIEVILTDQTNKGTRSKRIPFHRILRTVVIKFNDLRIDEIPDK